MQSCEIGQFIGKFPTSFKRPLMPQSILISISVHAAGTKRHYPESYVGALVAKLVHDQIFVDKFHFFTL